MFFQDHAVMFALICAGIGVGYGIYLTFWLLGRPAGNERMQEIARAVQEGAAAYLKRQYITIAIVAIIPFLLLGFYNQLGWGAAIGFLVGAALSAAAGFIGMNVAVRSNVRTAAAAQDGLPPALNVAFKPDRLQASSSSASAYLALPATTGCSPQGLTTRPNRQSTT